MSSRKVLFVAVVMVGLMALSVGAYVQAFESPPPGAKIEGPELWGVVVLNATAKYATIRVKRVVDCDVETQAFIEDLSALTFPDPVTEGDLLNATFSTSGGLFGIPGKPVITKVKNFKREPVPFNHIYSFDAQIKFCIGCP